MNLPIIPERPKLRMVEPMWVRNQGETYLYLRDPIRVSEATLALPQPLAPLLAFLDGTRDLSEIRAAMAIRAGLSLTDEDVRSIIGQLDQALMIENGAYQDARRRVLNDFRAADHRPMSHAGAVYPESASELDATLDGWLARFPSDPDEPKPDGDLVGMLCPHIDYERGHATYAKLWNQARDDLADVELAIVLGTDHYGGPRRVTPTMQSYATPYGVLPTDLEAVEAIAGALGESAFDEELHHRGEHSIELALVWLHHFARGMEISVAPVLCGSFHEFVNGGSSRPEDDPELNAVLDALRDVVRRRRTLIIAAGDLAHVGPAFGDSVGLDVVSRAKLKVDDARSMSAVCAGDADRFLDISAAESDRRKICGLSPIYLMLRLLEGASGPYMGYDQRPADEADASAVSIAGALLYI